MGYLKGVLKKIALYLLKISLRRKHKVIFGKGVHINLKTKFEGNNFLSNNSSLVSSYIGFASYLGENTKISKAKIGKYSSIGPNVSCIYGMHPSHTFVSSHPAFFSLRAQSGFTFAKKQLFNEFPTPIEESDGYTIQIGNDVWIGAEVKIMDGITIGDGAIIAAGSLVNKDVPPYTIVGGIPTKQIKKRFTENQIDFLIAFKWWNKEFEWIKQNAAEFVNIEQFHTKYI